MTEAEKKAIIDILTKIVCADPDYCNPRPRTDGGPPCGRCARLALAAFAEIEPLIDEIAGQSQERGRQLYILAHGDHRA